MNRLGILGGTFDPVHNAHLELAQAALSQYKLDEVLFVPSGISVRKQATIQATAEQRLRMLELACEGIPNIAVSTLEIDRPQTSYTVDTLRQLKKEHGQACQLYLILGEDTATDLTTWMEADEIARLAHVLYAKREHSGEDLQELPEGFEISQVEMPLYNISSSELRDELILGRDVSVFVPPAVLQYIHEQGLYG